MAGDNERVKGLFNLFKKKDDCLATIAKRLKKVGVSLYTFLHIAGVEPANNTVESTQGDSLKRKSVFGRYPRQVSAGWSARFPSNRHAGNKSGPILRCCAEVQQPSVGTSSRALLYDPVMLVA